MAGKPNKPIEYAKEPTGRPSKFTPEIRASIIDDICHRVPYEFAAEANGISEVTLYEWINKGKAHLYEGIESDYSIFAKAIKRAETNKMRGHCDNIADHVDKWQGDAWMLERRWHKHYSTNAGLNELNSKMDKLMGQENEKRNNEERNVEDDKEV